VDRRPGPSSNFSYVRLSLAPAFSKLPRGNEAQAGLPAAELQQPETQGDPMEAVSFWSLCKVAILSSVDRMVSKTRRETIAADAECSSPVVKPASAGDGASRQTKIAHAQAIAAQAPPSSSDTNPASLEPLEPIPDFAVRTDN